MHLRGHTLVLLVISIMVVGLGILVSPGHGTGTGEVQVCHRPPGNPSKVQIMEFSKGSSALDAHLAHGDRFVETFYQDADGDGYGTPLSTIQACSAPDGFVANNTDCDDTRAAVHPGAVETKGNGIDDDCDPNTLDVVCPCEGLSVGEAVWADSFTAVSCSRRQSVAILNLAGTSGTKSASMRSGATGEAGLCNFGESEPPFSDFSLFITGEEGRACEQSIREIAANDGVTCPP